MGRRTAASAASLRHASLPRSIVGTFSAAAAAWEASSGLSGGARHKVMAVGLPWGVGTCHY